ncbi:DUF1330 domain-containing protein [Variovorax sp. PBL-E5]|uniref:DUF1330 domain-containing protein n=1 Tax=Variovorax sp. PBL-E5 TaxID=434014 RepID=UPI00131770A8|nr:DUF1330 domain-containing protein [Variovorax sp. PBL-E5]VTU38619.1 hypothetical protein E5CHR_04864 [Variovorax sp. PBL-E5]
MKTILITLARVEDAVRYARYAGLATHAAAAHGARFLTRGAPLETLEGQMGVNRAVVSLFDSPDAARTYYRSQQYQAARLERLGAAQFEMVMAQYTEPEA